MKIALYSRVSTSMQSNGLESQTRTLIESCKSKGYEDYEIFEDVNVSGAKTSRPQLDKMMKEVREGKFQAVYVYSFSRFARSTKYLLEALEEFTALKCNFLSYSESVDLSSPMGRAMFVIISAIATLEREITGERVRSGMANARAKGRQIGRPRTLNDELISKLRSEGYTYREISSLLKIGQGSITASVRRSAQKQKLTTQTEQE